MINIIKCRPVVNGEGGGEVILTPLFKKKNNLYPFRPWWTLGWCSLPLIVRPIEASGFRPQGSLTGQCDVL